MKIWHISDTHTYHNLLTIPDNIDIVIHSGDASISRESSINDVEMREFFSWYSKLPIEHKIYVAGNHDTSVERRYYTKHSIYIDYGVHYLENEMISIKGINIWGSPYTPIFGNWAFMMARHKLERVWSIIPELADIIVVHGPPKGIMDLSYDRSNILENCGCNALKKRILGLQPKLFLSGHIHNNKDIINAGTLKLSAYDTIFSNGSVVTDGKFGRLSSNGNIFDL